MAADYLFHTILFVDNIADYGRPISSLVFTVCSILCNVFLDASILLDQGPVLDCDIIEINTSTKNEENVVYNWTLDYDPREPVIEVELLSLSAIDTLTGCMSDSMILISSIVSLPLLYINISLGLSCQDSTVTLDASNSESSPQLSY